MGIIEQCLSLVPVPYLSPAFRLLHIIWLSVQQAQASKRQLETLAQSIAQILDTLNEQYHTGRLLQVKTSTSLSKLHELLGEISASIKKDASCMFLKLLFTKDQRIARIEGYHRRIATLVTSFQITSFLDIHAWQARNDSARAADQQELNERLTHLEANQQMLRETLNVHQRAMVAMMASLQIRLQTGFDGDRERQFYKHALTDLITSSGSQVEIEDWTITSDQVEFGQEIGSGGFGKVFKGSWNRTEVALKVFIVEGGVAPSSEVLQSIRSEIEILSKVRHPNILQFIGANILDERPFILTPYLANGNARGYLLQHPNHNRLHILHGISLGLICLHSHQIVHGDLKALNVLVGDGGNAVLCDFGLSRVKADLTSREMKLREGHIVGSRNWMSPERLQGYSMTKPCDIYAFAITLYEVFTLANEMPLNDLGFSDFVGQVVDHDFRPKRPGVVDVPQLSDELWQLAEKCWVKDPNARPTAIVVCDTLSPLLHSSAVSWPFPSRSSHEMVLAQQEPLHSSLHASSSIQLTPSPNLTLQGHTDSVWCAAFSNNGKSIVSGSGDCTIIVWDGETGNIVLGPLRRHTKGVGCIAFSSNGQAIVSGSYDNTVWVWDSVTGQAITGPFDEHTDAIWSVSFAPNSKLIASGSRDKTIRVWDVGTGNLLIGPLTGHTDWVTSVTFSGDGKQIVSGSKDKTVRVWDVKSGTLVHGPLTGHQFRVRFVGFSLGGERVVAASRYGDVCIWDTCTGSLVSGPSKQHIEGSLAMVFTPNSTWYCAVSPDGKWIAARQDGSLNIIQVWDSKSGQLVALFTPEHTEGICSVSFSPDSKRILSASMNKTIFVHSLDF